MAKVVLALRNCVQRTNIQNLKAIHNRINHYVNFSPAALVKVDTEG